MKKILWVGEFSELATGYSTYGKEILSRLFATGKYDIAELACAADPADQRLIEKARITPWKVYFNQPPSTNSEEFNAFSSRYAFAFGEWAFDKVALDFEPDIVIDIRDWWMVEHQERSALRPYFHWIWMPTIDAEPQNPQWIATMKNADSIFTYTDWAKDLLRKCNHINLIGSASPGVDTQIFHPINNKDQHKEALYLPQGSFIVGTVMRNQKRKLFPELISSFSTFLNQAPDELRQRSYLYLHTSYPDWWEIPDYLNKYGVARKTLLTYKCLKCGHIFAHRFQGSKTFCIRCMEHAAFIPNTHLPLDRRELAAIINGFDVYIQYANSEGFGMPLAEAASCGIPVFATDYSAMSDVIRKLKGFPIKVESLQCEAETGCYRAIPSNIDLVSKLLQFCQLPEDVKRKKGYEARRGVEKHYDWNNIAKIWESHLDQIVPPKNRWDDPPHLHDIQLPANISSTDEFVNWIIKYTLGRPDLCDGYMAMRMTRDLINGITGESTGDIFFNDFSATGIHAKRRGFTRDDAVKELSLMRRNINLWETRRAEKDRSASR